jgi:hypothetical protein
MTPSPPTTDELRENTASSAAFDGDVQDDESRFGRSMALD